MVGSPELLVRAERLESLVRLLGPRISGDVMHVPKRGREIGVAEVLLQLRHPSARGVRQLRRGGVAKV